MDEMMSPFINIYDSLSLLELQEKECQSVIGSALLKDHVLSLKLALRFLGRFLSVPSYEELEMRITRGVFDVRTKLHSLSNKLADGSLILDLDSVYADLREKMKNVIINPETREYDVIFPKIFNRNGYFRKINNFLLEGFGDLSSCKADLIAPSIKEKLLLLQPLLTYVADTVVCFTEENKCELFTPLITLLDKAASLLYSCLVDKMDEEMSLAMNCMLSDLGEKIRVKEIYIAVLKASKLSDATNGALQSEFFLLHNLIKLLECNATSGSYLNGPSEKLYDKLKFFKAFLSDLPHELRLEKLNYLLTSIESITWKAIPILSSCYDKEMKEDMDGEVNDALSKVLDQIKHIQAEATEIKLYNYPKTDALGFLDLFLGQLEKLLNYHTELNEILKNQIRTLHEEFDFLRSFLRIIKQQHDEYEEVKDLWTRIIGLAYEAEYVIDIYLARGAPDSPDSHIIVSFSELIRQTMLIKLDVTRIYDEEKYYTQAQDVAKTSSHVPSQVIDTTIDELVGFKDEVKKIMEYLVADQKKLDVVSIVGMPGLGKTTLAKKIYEDPSLVERFDVQAWCSVSQTYRKRELLLKILGDIVIVDEEINNEEIAKEEINKLNDEQLAAKLYRSLKGRRYLIIIDDLWDIKAWNDLKRSLPDDRNHSRILITSRLQNVVSQTKAGSKVHLLREFSDDESWELFEKKLFRKERLSQELLKVGKQIVQSCKRLPLAIVVIAGLLTKVEKNVDKWKQIAVNVSSHIFSDSKSQCKIILELSYNHLPDHLKSCFLYFGAFAEDEEIPVWKLKQLWIAEGFVGNNEVKSLDDVAEECFVDLISRSLVIATKERSNGGVKACRVHDLLHDFCFEKAKEQSFLQVIHVDHWSEFSSVYDQRRLRICSHMYDLIEAKPFGCGVRSLLLTATTEMDFLQRDVSFIFQNFKLLRVLDLVFIDIGEYFGAIEKLIHLRYLAVKAETASISSSIANLWNLQFLLVKAYDYYDTKVVNVPDSLWDMVNLRHVHIDYRASFGIHHSRLESSLLDNLETLSTPCFSSKEDAENLLRRLPKLRKLRCIFIYRFNHSTNCYQFPVLDSFGQLLSLKVFFRGSLQWGQKSEFKFPLNLKKLTLLDFHISWDEISKIGRALPNLEVLKLIKGDRYHTWIVNDGDFPKLKYLKLSNLHNICEWIASEDSFPNLEQLVLDSCNDLNEIPPCFGEIPTVRMITVRCCKPSVDDSARRIHKEQHEELQNEELKVYIYPKKED